MRNYEKQSVFVLVKSWSNSKQQISNYAKEEQKVPYFVAFTTKYGTFDNYP